MHKNKISLLVSYFIFCFNTEAQHIIQVPDSLKKFTYDNYREKIYNDPQSNFRSSYIYAQSNLLKAKNENNKREIIYGYDLFAEIFEDFNKSVKYSDSAINLANKEYRKALPYLYSTRGYLFYNEKRLKESLNCFLIASMDTINLSQKLQNNINYSIGLIKKTQGNYNEAIKIYQKCMMKAYKSNDDNYLRYILGLAELYNRVNDTKMSENFTNKGMNSCRNYTFGNFYLPYFISNRGKNHFQRKRYNIAITDLKSALKSFKKSDDFSNYAENCFYIGESYTSLNQSENAIFFYKKVDSIFKEKKDISLVIIPAYSRIIDYFKKQKKYKEVVYYSDQFIKADKVLDENYKYITSAITKKYDIMKVISSKQNVISTLRGEKFSLKTTILVLFFGIMLLLSLLYVNNKRRKKEVEKQSLLFEAYKKDKETIKTPLKRASIENIDENVVNYILDCLKKFEFDLKYIEMEYTIEMLASEFKTNSKYLSKVINSVKDVSFTQYINNLRIEYILNQLEKDKKIVNYTIQALSEICGYNSVQTFTRAFTTYTKMKPSDFIKELKISIDKKV